MTASEKRPWSTALMFIPAALVTWLLHEFAHWQMGEALGITIYWPLVVLAAAVNARGASGWEIDETAYWIVLPVTAIWAMWSMFLIARTASEATEDT